MVDNNNTNYEYLEQVFGTLMATVDLHPKKHHFSLFMKKLHTDNIFQTLNGSPGPLTLQKVLSHLVSIAFLDILDKQIHLSIILLFLQVNSSRSSAPRPPSPPMNPLLMTNHFLYLAGKRKRCCSWHDCPIHLQRPRFLRYVRQVPILRVPMFYM